MRIVVRVVVALAATMTLLAAGTASATPLGLAPGDVVTQLEWEAFKSNGDGGSFDESDQTIGVDGEITSVTVSGPTTNPLTGVDLRFDGDVASSSFTCFANCGGSPLDDIVLVILAFQGSASVSPDLTLTDGTGVILEADFATDFQVGGLIDLASPVSVQVQQIVANDIVVTGGDSDLVNALGGLGGMSTLELTGTIFDFAPGLATLLADCSAATSTTCATNEDFTFSGGGLITPQNPSAFVPEPGTGILVGLGLGALASRRRGRTAR